MNEAVTFNPEIGLGSVITIIVLVSGLIGGWYTLKTEFKDSSRRLNDVESKQDDLEKDFQAHKLYLSERYVKRDDIKDLETRIGKAISERIDPLMASLKEANHKLGNVTQKIDERVLALLRFKQNNKSNDE